MGRVFTRSLWADGPSAGLWDDEGEDEQRLQVDLKVMLQPVIQGHPDPTDHYCSGGRFISCLLLFQSGFEPACA